MKKKIIFITQAKGGSGKSVLTFMLAEKYRDAEILDLDDATTTSMKQLAYRKPQKVSFLDHETKRIDRGAFNLLFQSVIRANIELFIADLGASVAEQLPKYFSLNGVEFVTEVLRTNNVQLQLICVVGGGNIFRASMEYLTELVQSVNGNLEIIVAVNGFFPLTTEQHTTLNQFAKTYNLPLTRFDLIHDKGENAMRAVETVLNEGNGIVDLAPFTAIYFRKGMDDLKL